MSQRAIDIQTFQTQFYQEIKWLSSQHFAELLQFISFLKYRDRLETAKQPLVLEGLWEDISFEVTDEEVRALRQQTTHHTEGKLNGLFS
ncbi:MAG TPA: hypothetical protein ENI48_03230 [Thioploca sp.]|nr:hypothetical protein [Thioploca sp.]